MIRNLLDKTANNKYVYFIVLLLCYVVFKLMRSEDHMMGNIQTIYNETFNTTAKPACAAKPAPTANTSEPKNHTVPWEGIEGPFPGKTQNHDSDNLKLIESYLLLNGTAHLTEPDITIHNKIYAPDEVMSIVRNWCHDKKYDLGFDDQLVVNYYAVYGYDIIKG
jgi:hypothetical protein